MVTKERFGIREQSYLEHCYSVSPLVKEEIPRYTSYFKLQGNFFFNTNTESNFWLFFSHDHVTSAYFKCPQEDNL